MAANDLERKFRLIWIGQSDGKTKWLPPKSKELEPNAPPRIKQLNTQGGEMAYEEVDFNDRRHKEWRKRLATLLVQDVVDKKRAANEDVGDLETTRYILGALPEGYKLFEGTRHEGTKLRKEIFVYGHPEGPKKRYRAAREFVPHLAWLSNDSTLDPRNCECKFCAPNDAQKAFEEMTAWQMKRFGIKPPEDTKGSSAATQIPTSVPRRDSVSSQNRPQGLQQAGQPRPSTTTLPSRSNSAIQQPTTEMSRPPGNNQQSANTAALRQYQPQSQNVPAAVPQQPIIAPNQKPTPRVQAINLDQKLDAQPDKFMFRQGETVWFVRGEGGGSFGLGVVVSRRLQAVNGREQLSYTVQPLCHPYTNPPAEEIYDDTSIKPWLAFSPPTPFHEPLQKVNVPFHKLPWTDILGGKYGPGDVEADGSIFAARTVDGTYTTFEPLAQATQERSYNGVFLGNEKIWRGEAVRLAGDTPEGRILIITGILEVMPIPNQPAELIFVGDVYVWKQLRPEDKSPPSNSFLPQLVNLDLEFRNKAAKKAGKGIAIWHFVESCARFSYTDVKGRWYPSRQLIPSLCGEEEFQAQIAEGEILDAGTKINSRGDYATVETPDNMMKAIIKRDTRAAAFGASIPATGSDFGLTPASYTNVLVPRTTNTKAAQANTQLPPGYPTQQQTLAQQYANLDPAQRARLANEQERARIMAQNAQAGRNPQTYVQQGQPQQQQQQNFVQNVDPQDQNAMDIDFQHLLN